MKSIYFLSFFVFFISCSSLGQKSFKTGNVIFIHPDGMSLGHWDALRLFHKGSRGFLNYDELPFMAVYRGILRDQVTATSNAGATIHSFGVRTGKESFGMDDGKNIISASKEPHSILFSAKKRGMSVALLQSGALIEPGTAVFAVSASERDNKDEIALKVIQSGAHLIFAGGEKYLLPQEVQGHFGKGARKDQINVIELAQKNNYQVIYNLQSMNHLPEGTQKVLGIFAHEDTYNDEKQEVLNRKNLDHYQAQAPTISEMTKAALDFLKKQERPFLLVVEEEGTDNFSNKKNAHGFLTAGKRADEAIGVARKFLKEFPNTLLLVASDSNASGLMVGEPSYDPRLKKPFYSLDGEYPFSILWTSSRDLYGGVVVKAEGLNADQVTGVIENTRIYHLIYQTLFGKKI